MTGRPTKFTGGIQMIKLNQSFFDGQEVLWLLGKAEGIL